MIHETAQIHESAYVAGVWNQRIHSGDDTSAQLEPGECEIGARTKVWHGAQIRSGAIIGEDCVIGKDVYIDAGVIIGDRSKIQNGVSIYRGVILHDEVFVGPGAVFTNDKHPRAVGAWEITPTVLHEGCSIGAGAVIMCGVAIGKRAMVGAGAVVTHDVEDDTTVVGNPAYVIDLRDF